MKTFALLLTTALILSAGESLAQPPMNTPKQASMAPTNKPRKPSFARNYGMAGCGLGSVVIDKKGGQLFAATTNSTFYNQLFAITFNTSNCDDNPNNEVAQRMDTFVAGNQVAIAGDAARGSGETISHLSALMGCQAESEEVASVMQHHFATIFPDETVTPNEVTDSIITVIMNQRNLAQHCKNIVG